MSVERRSAPSSLRLYCAFTSLRSMWRWHYRRRARTGKEELSRLEERFGVASLARPDGPLYWFHAASVGESMSVLALIESMLAAEPDAHILVTTGTVTSAAVMKERLPTRAFHQFAPADEPRAVRRFLGHWRPEAAFWVEQELWPTTIWETAARGVPLALVNARMSARSFRGWRRAPRLIAALLGSFDICLAQEEEHGQCLSKLGAQHVEVTGNLKSAAPPLPCNRDALAVLEADAGTRPCWLAASIHPGEDDFVAATHAALRAALPALLTVIVPRHPERAGAMAAHLGTRGLAAVRRSHGGRIAADIDVYLADTIGELGLFYRLAPVAFIGGSLVPHGGQNPLEAVKLGCAVVHGPHVANFAAVYERLDGAGAALAVDGGDGLTAAVARLMKDEEARTQQAARAAAVVESGEDALTRTLVAVSRFLERSHGTLSPP